MHLTFIHLPEFARQCKRYGMTDEDVQALEAIVGRNVHVGSVMVGTGGLRKFRYGPRGQYRVAYAYFPIGSVVYFMMIFAKANQANLTDAEKHHVRKALAELAKYHRA